MQEKKPEQVKTKEKLPSNVLLADAPYNDVRIILSYHDKSNTQEEYGEAEVVCLEVANYDRDEDPARALNIYKNHPQQLNLMPNKNFKKFYFTDTFGGDEFESLLKEELISVSIASALAKIPLGAGVLTTALTRRKFLGLGALGLGAYFSITDVNKYLVANGYGIQLPISKVEDELPLSIGFRNLVMAHKVAFISDKVFKETGKRPKIAMPVGAWHATVKEAFKVAPEDRKKMMIEVVGILKEQLPAEEYKDLLYGLFVIPEIIRDESGRMHSNFLKII